MIRRLLLIASSLVVGFALLELLLRAYNPIPFRVKGDRIVLPVNQVFRFENTVATKLDPVIVHHKNSLGFRGPEPPRDFDRRLTIVAVGGSTTEGLFLNDGRTWPDELGRRLAERRPGAWVNNAGLDGHSTFGHLVLVRDYLVPLRPKVALFLIGINDVGRADANTFDNAVYRRPASLVKHALDLMVAHSETMSLFQNGYRAATARAQGFGHSEIDVRQLRDFAVDDETVRKLMETHAEQFVPAFAARVRRLIVECRDGHIDPVLITQPALFGATVDPSTGVDLSRVQVNGRGNGASEWQLLQLYNDATRRVGAEERVLVIDLANTMPKDSALFYDFLHFTNAGAERVGRLVFEGLYPHLE